MELLQRPQKRGRIVPTKGQYPVCPVCGNRMSLKVLPSTSGKNIPSFCRKCKTEIILDIDRGQCTSCPCP